MGFMMFGYQRAPSLTPLTQKGMPSVRRISRSKPLSEDAPLLPGTGLRALNHLKPASLEPAHEADPACLMKRLDGGASIPNGFSLVVRLAHGKRDAERTES
ncbi:unnamed protein product [Symbiodinium sp. CCMP2456]|nr:unnamed protein product [Symbiodinium sp. CCMP2456]